MSRVHVSLVAVVVLIAGCASDPRGTLFRTTVAGPDGSYAQEVVLGDQTGLVTSIEPAEIDGPDGFDPPSVASDPDDPTTLIFRWSNGACDRPAISFSRSSEHVWLRVEFREKLGGCMAILLFRAIRIHLSQAIPAEQIEVCCRR